MGLVLDDLKSECTLGKVFVGSHYWLTGEGYSYKL